MPTRYLPLFGLLLALTETASAAACIWNGSTGAWTSASSWSCSAVPGPSDDVVIGAGTVTMDTGTRLVIGALTLTGGTLTGGTLTGPDSLTVGGALVWEAGTMAGAGATLIQGATTLRASTAKNVARELILMGETVWSDGTIQLRDGGLLRNRGQFFDTAVGSHAIARVGTFTTEPLVHNQGRWQVASAGTNTNVDFLNVGTLFLSTNGLKVNAPARFTNAPASQLSGGGTLDLSSGALVAMDGFVQPGGHGVVGFFEVRGPYPMGPQHVLDIEIGTGVPTADLLQVANGTTTIGGRLRLHVPASGVPSQPLTVVTHGGTGGVVGCYGPDDIDVVGPDGFPAPYEAEVACTTSTVTVTLRAATAGEEAPGGAVATLDVTGGNPFTSRTELMLTVPASGHTTVEALDALGRRVAVLFQGVVAARQPVPVAFEAGALPAGRYVVRAMGERVALTRPLTLVR